MNNKLIEKFEAGKPLQVGMYAMHHMNDSSLGTLVKVDSQSKDESARFGVRYVQITAEGAVIGGGSSYLWPLEQFKPISNPLLLAAAEAFECQLKVDEAIYTMKKMERDRDIRKAAVLFLLECGFKRE
jgi:hypothetical protein